MLKRHVEIFADVVATIRQKVPGIALRTTLLAGYPGETIDDHEETLAWVEKTKFDRLGVFQYSHEENTHAYTLSDDLPAKEKKRRAEAIMAVQQPISLALNSARIGKILKVLVDRKEGRHFIGRTEQDSPEVDNEVLIPADKHFLRVGDFADIKITGAEEYDLVGEPV